MKQIEYAVQPGLTDIRITWNDAATGAPLPSGVVRQTPANLPPIFRGTRLVSFALLPKNCPACKVVLSGSFGDSQYTSEVAVNPDSNVLPGEQIIKLGVRSMIEDIQNGCGGIPADRRGDIQKAVSDLSVKYDVMSKYTAFVAVGSGGEALETSMVTRRVSRTSESSQSVQPSLGINASDQNMDELQALLASLDEDERRRLELDLGIYQPRFNFGLASIGSSAPRSERSMEASRSSMMGRERDEDLFTEVRRKTHGRRCTGGRAAKRSTDMQFESIDDVDDDEEEEEEDEDEDIDYFCSAPRRSRPCKRRAELSFQPQDRFRSMPQTFGCANLDSSYSSLLSEAADEASFEAFECANLCSCYSSSLPVAAGASVETFVDKTKSLDNVILQQKASGCFEELALELLDIPDGAKNARPTALPVGVTDHLADEIWTTLLVVLGLQDKYGDKKSEWSYLATKSENWVRSNLGAAFDEWKAAATAAYNRFRN